MSERVQAFLEGYQKAISEPDAAAVASFYADVFMFGGPSGVQSVRKEDFLRVVPKRKQWIASLGLVDSRVRLIDETSLDSKYCLLKTEWEMSFENGGSRQQIEARATYILELKGDAFQIVLKIDHQDLSARVKELRLG